MKLEYNSKFYPEKLRKIENPPKQIFAMGNIQILNDMGIAIIGSRNCSTYGARMAKMFTKKLNQYNINIISGMALGIDKYAHLTTIEERGKTIAVLPCGFNHVYPKENIFLIDKIINSNGCIISEYNPEEKATSKKFLERNRIVSGISDGVLIVEGGYRSGTSVTAKLAKEQNKKVFCVPSSLENPKGLIPNKLIKEGAILVRDEKDIIYYYENIETKKIEELENKNVSKEFIDLYNIINDEIYIDDIVRKSNLKIEEVNYQLIMLELEGIIEQLPGKRYRRKYNV